MSTATDFFFMLVGEHADDGWAVVALDTPIESVAQLMATEKHSAVIIADGDRRPVGIVTEQDIVRRVVFRADPRQPVSDVMSEPVHAIAEDERMFIAIARMRRLGHRHMPVVDDRGRACGMLDLHRTLQAASGDLIDRIDELTRDDTLDGLRDVKAAQVDVAASLLADNVPALEVQQMLTHINNDIYRRVTERNIKVMADEGHGPPPVPFCVIIMGSGGRGENFLSPDQDYGFVLADYDDAEHDRIDPWYVDLALRISADLDTVGLPYCKGHVMAQNPVWRKTITQWQGQLDFWNRRMKPTALLNFDIFFDFRPGWGDPALARTLRRYVTDLTHKNEPFMRALFTAGRDHGTALRLFGRFKTETSKPEHKGKINLKFYGSLPLVEGVRLLALSEGIQAPGTSERLTALHQAGRMTYDEYDDLNNAQETLCALLLNRQILDVRTGGEASNYVHPGALSGRQRRRLRGAFKAIDALRTRIKFEFGGEVF